MSQSARSYEGNRFHGLRFSGTSGAMHIDASDLQLSEEQAAAVSKLAASGDITRLSDEDRAVFEGINVNIGKGLGDAAAFVRFDLKVVRIDKAPSLDWEEIEEVTILSESVLRQE